MAASFLPQLPSEIWDVKILTRLDRYDLGNLSLACKELCRLVGKQCRSLSLAPAVSAEDLPGILARRPCLEELDLARVNLPSEIILQTVAASGLDLRAITMPEYAKFPKESQLLRLSLSMKNLKAFRLPVRQTTDLVTLSRTIPFLEELEISGDVVTDGCIMRLSPKFRNLKRMTLSQSNTLTDWLLVALSSNCGLLNAVWISGCQKITSNGIAWLLRKCPNLSSIRLTDIDYYKGWQWMIYDSIRYARNLKQIEFGQRIPQKSNQKLACDQMLASIAASGLPLTSMIIHNETDTAALIDEGVVNSFRLCGGSIEKLNFYIHRRPSGRESLHSLFPYLPKLTDFRVSINVIRKSQLVTLIKCCPLLEKVSIFSGWYQNDATENPPRILNRSVQSLALEQMPFEGYAPRAVCDDTLKELAVRCPNLQTLHTGPVSNGRVFEHILKECPKIKHLKVAGMEKSQIFSTLDQPPATALQVLELHGSSINDYDIYLIGQMCPNLVRLNLEFVDQPPTNFPSWLFSLSNPPSLGLMRMMFNCKKLRKLVVSENSVAPSDVNFLSRLYPSLKIEVVHPS